MVLLAMGMWTCLPSAEPPHRDEEPSRAATAAVVIFRPLLEYSVHEDISEYRIAAKLPLPSSILQFRSLILEMVIPLKK